MPHAVPSVAPGLQALILCGPGVSLNTFTSNPEEFPKALIPIANRPMVWYALDFCYRMGITGIFLVTPRSSAKAIDAALSQNPHLTSLPVPRATILAPEDLTQTSGTADILRLPEVRAALQGDFILLPCDLVCEVPGHTFLEQWMIHQTSALQANAGPAYIPGRRPDPTRNGGLGVWYPTKGEDSVKKEETDFIMTTPLLAVERSPIASARGNDLSRLVYSTTTDTVKDITEERDHFPIRYGLIRRYGCVKMLTTYRDAHIYIFPLWVLDFVARNDTFDSISEDVVGWWAKCGWQNGLDAKLGLKDALSQVAPADSMQEHNESDEFLDLMGMSSTHGSVGPTSTNLASASHPADPAVPPILAFVQPTHPAPPLLRRVDTHALLLAVSLRLAKLPALDESPTSPSPLAFPHKVAYPAGVAPRCTVTRQDCLLGDNVTVEEKCAIKESVVGANCQVKSGAKLTRCVLMDGVVVEAGAQLAGCIVGRRAHIGQKADLKDCRVQEGFRVPDGREAKGEDITVGLEESMDGEEMEMGDEIEF